MKTNRKITRKELCNILNISKNTCTTYYRAILDCLSITDRDYLTENDLKTYGIIPKDSQ